MNNLLYKTPYLYLDEDELVYQDVDLMDWICSYFIEQHLYLPNIIQVEFWSERVPNSIELVLSNDGIAYKIIFMYWKYPGDDLEKPIYHSLRKALYEVIPQGLTNVFIVIKEIINED